MKALTKFHFLNRYETNSVLSYHIMRSIRINMQMHTNPRSNDDQYCSSERWGGGVFNNPTDFIDISRDGDL